MTSPEKVIFTKNSTEAINLLFHGLLNEGDHVIISCYEHNAVLRPLHYLKQMGVIDYSVICREDLKLSAGEIYEKYAKNNTRLLALTLASNLTGRIVFKEEWIKYFHDKGVVTFIDSSQGAGKIPIRMKDFGVDFLAFTGHKDLYGIPGVGGLCCEAEIHLQPLIQGGTGIHGENYVNPDIFPEGYEAGTLNMPAIWALKAGIEYVGSHANEIMDKETDLIKYLLKGLSDIEGLKVYDADKQRVPTCCFTVDDLSSDKMISLLDSRGICARGGIHCAILAHEAIGTVKTGAVRISLNYKNTKDDIGKDTLLVVDEAHNFGSDSLRRKLYPQVEYRLALSATLERHGDQEGTEALKQYFGDKCIEYGLKRAIDEGKLTPYYYYPIVVYLNEDELNEYKDISYQIKKECHQDKRGKIKISEKGKMLLMKRARVVAGAYEKLVVLKEKMNEYKDDSHILVYCGATRVQSFEYDESERDEEGERQIVAVSKLLGKELGMKVTHFTSNESAAERELIKREFSTVSPYQAIVAIKCLDEGVNIPSIKTAFILASTTNPKEYIQRRGRVLRLAPNKPYAVIYDFVTLASPLEDVNIYATDFNCERALAKRELIRIKEFGEIALNSRSNIENCQKAIDKFAKSSTKNQRTARLITYAQRVYEWLMETYKGKEQKVREELQIRVNDNFAKMYHGERSIQIDEKYRVTYIDVKTDESDGLKAVKSFAFIASLVSMAKDKILDDADMKLGQVYPLVMDAPFSNVDTISEKKKHTSELSRTFTEDVFKKAYELFIEQADKNAVSKKSNGDKLPFGITKADDERIKEIDGGGRFGVGQHFGQGAASKTPYINWFVVSIYYMPDTGSVVMGIEKDRYPKLKQMEPRRYTQLGNKRTEVAVFFDSSKDYLNYEKLYNAFIDVSEQVMKLEGWA